LIVPTAGVPATLTVNVLGSWAAGLAVGLLEPAYTHRSPSPAATWVRPLLVVGFLGGFTTLSAVSAEALLLLGEAMPTAGVPLPAADTAAVGGATLAGVARALGGLLLAFGSASAAALLGLTMARRLSRHR